MICPNRPRSLNTRPVISSVRRSTRCLKLLPAVGEAPTLVRVTAMMAGPATILITPISRTAAPEEMAPDLTDMVGRVVVAGLEGMAVPAAMVPGTAMAVPAAMVLGAAAVGLVVPVRVAALAALEGTDQEAEAEAPAVPVVATVGTAAPAVPGAQLAAAAGPAVPVVATVETAAPAVPAAREAVTVVPAVPVEVAVGTAAQAVLAARVAVMVAPAATQAQETVTVVTAAAAGATVVAKAVPAGTAAQAVAMVTAVTVATAGTELRAAQGGTAAPADREVVTVATGRLVASQKRSLYLLSGGGIASAGSPSALPCALRLRSGNHEETRVAVPNTLVVMVDRRHG